MSELSVHKLNIGLFVAVAFREVIVFISVCTAFKCKNSSVNLDF